MGKKRSWFSLVKRLFIPKEKSEEEKKSNRWRWFFGRLKLKQYPSLAVAQRTLSEAHEEQRKHALVVAIATAAAAEAAIAAAHAAAEVVRLSGIHNEFEKKKRNQNLAAIKIQSVYRAHLARKALRALKGIVRLQAVVRGQNIRRKVTTKLKCLQSIAETHSQVHQMRVSTVYKGCKYGEKKHFLSPKKGMEETEIELEGNSNRNWDFHLSSKEDMQETTLKRERMKRYSCSQRERRNGQILGEFITNKEAGRQNHHLEQWAEAEACRRRETEKLKSTNSPNLIDSATHGATQLKLRNTHKQGPIEELNSPVSHPRRSFCRVKKQESTGDDSSLPNSPVFPTYMASTESAKAKVLLLALTRHRRN